jgi:hypothetical protein
VFTRKNNQYLENLGIAAGVEIKEEFINPSFY